MVLRILPLRRRQPQQHNNNNIKTINSNNNNNNNIVLPRQRNIRILSKYATIAMFGLVCIALPNFVAFKVKSTTTLSSYTTLQPIIHSNTTYGHIHMAKSGGTTLNGILALNYERVCGHKGYSYDYVQANKRFKNSENWRSVSDSLTQKKLYNRGRVPVDIMEEIGYEDCDWISQEVNWDFWLENFLAS